MRRFLIWVFALLLPLVALSACTKAPSEPNITIENASVRLPLPGQTTAAAYFDIVNKGSADVLLSATAPISDTLELHNHLHENGVMTMRRVESVTIPAQKTTQFKSGGHHVMIFNVDLTAENASFPLTLIFEKSGEVVIDVSTGTAEPHAH